MASGSTEKVAFGPYEFEPRTGRLWKLGFRVKLQPKSQAVLSCLIEKAGEPVTREELRARLWPSDVFTDFNLGINVAVKRLRDALCDSADDPTYVQTVQGEGYRFIAPVTELPAEAAVEPATLIEAPPPARSRRTLLWACATAVLTLTIAAGIFVALRRPAIEFHKSDWVLIADFDNHTGEKLLDGALEYAVERELGNSQFVSVVPRDRVNDALRLMKKPVSARLDRATAREVCLRDGAIKAILTGRVDKLGTTYVLSVQVIDPTRDVGVASIAEEDPADTLLARAVRRLSIRVRETLGESAQLIHASNQQLEKVTTPSLRALELYSQADRTFRQFNDDSNQIAAELLEQSLKEDPDFASAHVLLGYAYGNLGKPADAAAHFRRAFELADKTTERERYFILGSYYGHQPVNQPEKAAELYETLLRRYPVHGWQLSMLAGIYNRMQKPDKLDDLSVRMADLRPNDARMQVLAAWNLAAREIRQAAWKQGKPGEVKPDFTQTDYYLARAIALRNTRALEETDDVSVRLYAAQIHWMEGKFPESRADALDAEQVDKKIKPSDIALYYAAFGDLHEAEKRLDRDPSPVEQAMLAYYRGDLNAARQFLRGAHVPIYSWLAGPAAVLLAHAGMDREAEAIRRDQAAWVSKAPWRTGDAVVLRIMDGELAAASGAPDKGTAILEKTLADADNPSFICNLMASEDLAQTYRKEGKLADAVRVLERAVAGPVWPSNFSAAWQQRLQVQLAQFYRESGRTADAQRVEQTLAKELAFADPDHPIVRQLAELSRPSTAMAVRAGPLPIGGGK